jgi:hypothetical protein
MNPQELRTGNFLSYDGRICIVTNIDSTGNFKLAPNGVFFCEFLEEPKYYIGRSDIENYEPIPLTEEWLLNLGVEYIDTVTFKGYKLDVGNMIIVYNNTVRLMGQPLEYIKYVHQFQNLYFALTGEELQVNL